MTVGQTGPGSEEIVVRNLSKQYKNLRAVDDLSFSVRSGRITGFLGPNGAGKTTTLRMLLNLVRPTSGSATIGGRRYVDLDEPIRHVGAVLEASSAHRGRTGVNHLRVTSGRIASSAVRICRATRSTGRMAPTETRMPRELYHSTIGWVTS